MLNNENKAKLVRVNRYQLRKPLQYLRVQKHESDKTPVYTIVFPAATSLYEILCSLELDRIENPVMVLKNGEEEEKYVVLKYFYDINEDNLNEADEIIVCKIQKI